MRKSYWLFAVSILWFTQISNLSFAQSPQPPMSPQSDALMMHEGLATSLRVISEMEVIKDGFGDYLYSYRDRSGKRHMTNSVQYISGELRVAEATEATLKNDKPIRENVIETDLKLSQRSESEKSKDDSLESSDMDEVEETTSDPFESLNRAIFQFNDRVYFWVLKPVAKGYRKVVPKGARVGVSNFFSNIGFPVRFVNCIFQAKFEGAGIELARFLVNSTLGVAGFFDVAKEGLNLRRQDEDLGQTLGVYGMGPAIFINWPILGPSNLRDTIGMVGDGFLNPVYYIDANYSAMAKTLDVINNTSLTIGDYEDLIDAAIDPYIALRDAYYQYRQNKIKH